MYTGEHELYMYEIAYCAFLVRYNDWKWWQFSWKRQTKAMLDYYYPLMRAEVLSRERNYKPTNTIE